MSELVFLLEEASAEEMLKGLLPRLLPADLSVRYITFEGKSDLEKQLVRRLRGYLVPNAQFIVLRDKDAGDCRLIKAGLVVKCYGPNCGRRTHVFWAELLSELEPFIASIIRPASSSSQPAPVARLSFLNIVTRLYPALF